MIQGGAGTSTNMNANEVIANRTLELLGHPRGDYARLHPLDQVNAWQSTNGVYPTAARIAIWTATEPLLTQLGHLRQVCQDRAHSGPAAGFGDIALPAVLAGSSIMPGKVNPVIPELVNQIAFTVIGQDLTISMAAEAGQLQLNAFEPVMVHCLLTELHHLSASVELLTDRCLTGITVNEAALRETVTNSAGLATALSPYLGYAAASALARDAQVTNRPVRELAQERGLLPPELIDALLAEPRQLAGTAGPQEATATRPPVGPPTTITGGTA